MGILPSLGNMVQIEVKAKDAEDLLRRTGTPAREPHVPPVLAAEDHPRWVGARAGQGGDRSRRLAMAGLSVVGLLESLYMLAYEEEHIDSLACPLFGEGCNTVGRSEHARHFGVPNAAVGAAAYGVMAALALWRGRGRPSWQTRALRGVAGLATAAGAFLTWEQGARVRAWCFWCLSSAAVNAGIFALSLAEPRSRTEAQMDADRPE